MDKQKIKLHNRFDFEILDTATGQKSYAKAENIVLNRFYTLLASPNHTYAYGGLKIGKGTGTLDVTRTELFSFLTSKGMSQIEEKIVDNFNGYRKYKATFSETEAIGVWTEVGIGDGAYSSSTSPRITTHAFITDAEGNTISINKTNTQIVTVYITIYQEVGPAINNSHYIDVGGSCLLKHIQGYYWGSSDYWQCSFSCLKTIDGKFAKIGTFYTTGITWTFDSDNYRVYNALTRLGTTVANNDIRSVAFKNVKAGSYGSAYEAYYLMGTSFPCENIFTGYTFENVAVGTGDGTTVEFDLPKNNPKPLSETIYKNGVALVRGVDYTIRYGLKSTETNIVDIPYTYSSNYLGGVDEIVVLPQPEDPYFDEGASTITAVGIGAYTGYSYSRWNKYYMALSTDAVNWVEWTPTYGESAIKMKDVTPGKYKYLKVQFSFDNSPTRSPEGWGLQIAATPPSKKHITFAVPPAQGDSITATFSVDYVPKSENFVVDFQGEWFVK